MPKYDVYAIGNALVDYEYEVKDAFLQELGISKGHMTLIDEMRGTEIAQKVGKNPKKKQSGGSAANTIIALSQLGGSGYYCCKVADDEAGKFYLDDLTSNQVGHQKEITSYATDKTGRCYVFVTPDAERTMNTFLGVTSRFSKLELNESELKQAEYLYIEGYLVASPTATEAIFESIAQAKKYGVKIALTLSDPGIVTGFYDKFKKILENKVDLLFCNEEEALKMTKNDDLDEAIEELQNYAHQFVVTIGMDGARGFDGEKYIDIPSFPVKAVDSNGAGDMFAGSFLYGMTHELGFKYSGMLAGYLSSKIVSQFGPRLTQDQMIHHLHEFREKIM